MTISKKPMPRGVKHFTNRGAIISAIYITADGKYSVQHLKSSTGWDLGWEVLDANGKHLDSYTSSSIKHIAADYGWEVI